MTTLIVLAVTALLVLLVVATLIGLYNSLVRKRVAVDNAWSSIGVQFARRHQLIPNLVETVKGYAAHERATFEAVAATRATTPAQAAWAENALTSALRGVVAVAEAYPQLRADRTFAELQAELADSENRIAYARQYYNDAVMTYNTAVRTVPTHLLAGVAGFTVREFFQAPESALAPVQVRF